MPEVVVRDGSGHTAPVGSPAIDRVEPAHAEDCNYRPSYCGPNAMRDGSEVLIPGRWCTCGRSETEGESNGD